MRLLDVVVRHDPKPFPVHGDDTNALAGQMGLQRGRTARCFDPKEYHVRVAGLAFDHERKLRQPTVDALGVGMVFRQALHMMVQRIDARGRQKSRLAHSTSKALPNALAFRNKVFGAKQQRAHRGAEPFAQANGHGIKKAQIFRRIPFADQRIEDAGPIEVVGQVVGTGGVAHLAEQGQPQAGAAALVGGVFEDHESGGRGVHVHLGLDQAVHVVGAEAAVGVAPGADLHAGVEGNAAALVVVDVGQMGANNLVAGARVDVDGDLVRHGAGGAEEARFLAKAFGSKGFQAFDGGVIAQYVVAHGSGGHSGVHGGGRSGDRIGSKVSVHHGYKVLKVVLLPHGFH